MQASRRATLPALAVDPLCNLVNADDASRYCGFIIKNGDRVGWLAVHNELIERMLAGFDTGRTLNGMNATDKIQCIDNKQMNSHDNPLKDQAIRVTFDAGTGYGWLRKQEEASQNEASGRD